jgi:hypothetical protein
MEQVLFRSNTSTVALIEIMRRLLWYGNSLGSDCDPNSSDNTLYACPFNCMAHTANALFQFFG